MTLLMQSRGSLSSSVIAGTLFTAMQITGAVEMPVDVSKPLSIKYERGLSEPSNGVVKLARADYSVELYGLVQSIFDRLLGAQKDLDEESRSLIYSRLWDMYE